MNIKKKLIILDFDDTLFFTHGAVRKAAEELLGNKNLSKKQVRKLPTPTKTRVYSLAYSKYKHESKPNNLLLEHLRKSRKGYDIIVLTARLKSQHNNTLSLIEKHNIKIQGIQTRQDLAVQDEEWKLQKIKYYLKKYPRLELYEDKRENIVYIKNKVNSENIRYYLVTKNNIKPIY